MNKIIKIIILVISVSLLFSQCIYAANEDKEYQKLVGKYWDKDTGKWDFSSLSTEELEKMHKGILSGEGNEYDIYYMERGNSQTLNENVYKNYDKLIQALKTEIDERGGEVVKANGEKISVSTKDSDEIKKKYNMEQIIEYKTSYGIMTETNSEIRDAWKKTLEETDSTSSEAIIDEIEKEEEGNSSIYSQPKLKPSGSTAEESIEDMLNDGDSFINSGTSQIDSGTLQTFSRTLFNILLSVGIIVAVIVGGVIGIKFMVSSAEGKAEVKQLLVPYTIGCVVVFGGFTIWGLIVTFLQGI